MDGWGLLGDWGLRQYLQVQQLGELLERHLSARPRILHCTYGRGSVWGHFPSAGFEHLWTQPQ